jgi:hypothetical protein
VEAGISRIWLLHQSLLLGFANDISV